MTDQYKETKCHASVISQMISLSYKKPCDVVMTKHFTVITGMIISD